MSENLVTVGTYGVLAEAHLAKAALALEGIEGYIANEYLTDVDQANQPILLKVRPGDARQAEEVLYRAHAGAEVQFSRGEAIRCPRCEASSTEIIRKPPERAFARVLYSLLHDLRRARFRCLKCAHEWELRW
jgi:hypothetical protein